MVAKITEIGRKKKGRIKKSGRDQEKAEGSKEKRN